MKLNIRTKLDELVFIFFHKSQSIWCLTLDTREKEIMEIFKRCRGVRRAMRVASVCDKLHSVRDMGDSVGTGWKGHRRMGKRTRLDSVIVRLLQEKLILVATSMILKVFGHGKERGRG